MRSRGLRRSRSASRRERSVARRHGRRRARRRAPLRPARRMGKRRIIAETGAGQHGVATATVAALMGMDCVVYMGVQDTRRQLPNVQRMELLGATVEPVEAGAKTLKEATSAAIRDWVTN